MTFAGSCVRSDGKWPIASPTYSGPVWPMPSNAKINALRIVFLILQPVGYLDTVEVCSSSLHRPTIFGSLPSDYRPKNLPRPPAPSTHPETGAAEGAVLGFRTVRANAARGPS